MEGSLHTGLYGKDCQCYKNPDRENIVEVWKDNTTDDAIVVIEKAVKAIKPKIVNSCWRKLCPDFVRDVTGFTTGPIKEIVDMAKEMWGEAFQGIDLGEIQELMDTPEELTEDHSVGMSASEPAPEDVREAVPENELTLGNLVEGFQLLKTAFDLV